MYLAIINSRSFIISYKIGNGHASLYLRIVSIKSQQNIFVLPLSLMSLLNIS